MVETDLMIKILGTIFMCMGGVFCFGGTRFFRSLISFSFASAGSFLIVIGLYFIENNLAPDALALLGLLLAFIGFFVQSRFDIFEEVQMGDANFEQISDIEDTQKKIKKAMLKLKQRIEEGSGGEPPEIPSDPQISHSLEMVQTQISGLQNKVQLLENKINSGVSVASSPPPTTMAPPAPQFNAAPAPGSSNRCHNCQFKLEEGIEYCPRCGIKQ